MSYIPYESAKAQWWINPKNKGKPFPEYLASEEAYNAYMRSVAPSASTQPSPTEVLKNPDVYGGSTGNSSDSSNNFFIRFDPESGKYVPVTDPVTDPSTGEDLVPALNPNLGRTWSRWNPNVGYDYYAKSPLAKDAYLRALISEIDSTGLGGDFWADLSDADKLTALEHYISQDTSANSLWGLAKQEYVDVATLLNHLQDLSKYADSFEAPVNISDYVDSSEDIYADIDEILNPAYNAQASALDDAYADLNGQLSEYYNLYSDQIKAGNQAYNQLVNSVLSQQYRNDVGAYDALRSDLRKSRQSALEAGASAGVRIAGNVNAMLSAQNKQSATALETSNQLAQMLLQQRNANAGLLGNYTNATSNLRQAQSQNRIAKSQLELDRVNQRESMYDSRRTAQMDDYKLARDARGDRVAKDEAAYTNADGNYLAKYKQAWASNNSYK